MIFLSESSSCLKQLLQLCDHISNLLEIEDYDSCSSLLPIIYETFKDVISLLELDELTNHEQVDLLYNGISSNPTKIYSFNNYIKQQISLLLQCVFLSDKYANTVDKKFNLLMYIIQNSDITNLQLLMKNNLYNISINQPEYYEQLVYFYKKYESYWGAVDLENNILDLIANRSLVLKEHSNDFIWLYNHLEDYRSRVVLNGILYNWISFNLSYLEEIRENNMPDYFDLDIFNCSEDEIFVDAGAYTGDSVESFIKTYGKYKKIYCYEITPSTFNNLCKNLSSYPNIVLNQKGLGAQPGLLYLNTPPLCDSSANTLHNEGTIAVEITSIDVDIKMPVTFIKMDIEGAEQSAIEGCKYHIKNHKPKLAICTYHNNEDIWKIPRMIHDINNTYKFYMRYNGKTWWPSEYTLLCK